MTSYNVSRFKVASRDVIEVGPVTMTLTIFTKHVMWPLRVKGWFT